MSPEKNKRPGELALMRRTLHRHPNLAGQEEETAQLVESYLLGYEPDNLITGLGGHGLAAVFQGRDEGPAVLLRADMDALPIPESVEIDHASRTEGVAHKCGHDGHMMMVAGLAQKFYERRPERGRVVLLFQPAEEVGKGARRVLDDERFGDVKPDLVYGLHNLPGFPLGSVILRKGTFASASVGMDIRLHGRTAHAAEPEQGQTPSAALAQIIQTINSAPQLAVPLHTSSKATVIHASLGEVAFGTTPGEAAVMATLRAHRQETLEALQRWCEKRARGIAEAWELKVEIEWREPFPETHSNGGEVERIQRIAGELDLEVIWRDQPFAWSEDFGHFTQEHTGAFFGLGTGEDHPALHNPEYDFPDELLETGRELWHRLALDALESKR